MTPMVNNADRSPRARRLAEEFERLGVSVKMAATSCGVTTQAVYKWLNLGTIDRRHESPLEAMGVDIRYVIDGRYSNVPSITRAIVGESTGLGESVLGQLDHAIRRGRLLKKDLTLIEQLITHLAEKNDPPNR